MKVRNTVFAILFCLFACGPTLLFLAEKFEIDVPENLTAAPAAYLAGGSSAVNMSDHWSTGGFINGKLQKALEDKIGTYIPAKATAIIVNASLQRKAIATSNELLAWDCYPTYYGSSRLYIPSINAVTYAPQQRSKRMIAVWQSFAHGVASIAERHPDKRFILYIVDGYQEPAYNPAYNLVSSPLLPSDCNDAMGEILGSLPNVKILTTPFNKETEYYANFFRTDHHWNINGALKAYQQIADELNLQPIEQDGTWQIPDYWFTGATARWGIDMLQESVFDCGNQFTQLVAILPDGTQIRGDDHSAFWNSPSLAKPYRFYDAYYDNLGDCTITGGNGDRTALLIGNSYKGAIQRPLAMSYHSLTVNNQLHPATPVEETLEKQIDATNADDIIFVANPGNYSVDKTYWE